MFELSSWTIPFFATLALVLAPGPAVLYIVGRSIDGGRTAGFASAAGIATGGLVHVAGAALGLSAAGNDVRYVVELVDSYVRSTRRK